MVCSVRGTVDDWLRIPIRATNPGGRPLILIVSGFIGVLLAPMLSYTGIALIIDWPIRKEKSIHCRIIGRLAAAAGLCPCRQKVKLFACNLDYNHAR